MALQRKDVLLRRHDESPSSQVRCCAKKHVSRIQREYHPDFSLQVLYLQKGFSYKVTSEHKAGH